MLWYGYCLVTFQAFVLRHLVIVFSFVLSALVSYIFLVQGEGYQRKFSFLSPFFSFFFLLLSILFVRVARHTFKYFRQYFSLTLHLYGL